jgi:hypothetical protein
VKLAALVVALAATLTTAACTSSALAGSGSLASGARSPSPVPGSLSRAPGQSSVPVTVPSGVDPANPYTRPEIAAAKAIPGVIYKPEPNHLHVFGHIQYDTAPPIGGNHSAYWADCTGTVYPHAIANENAVHMLEHGAVWITYNPSTLPSSELGTLESYVAGVDRMALSPYPNLQSPISLQSWDYQLFVSSASDPRIRAFILALRYNTQTTPEPGATCSQPTFKEHPSTFGHPLDAPVG